MGSPSNQSYRDSPFYCFYYSGSSYTAKQLYKWFKVNKIKQKITPEEKRSLCAKVFMNAFFKIIKDIIKNNITFSLPTIGANRAYLHVQPITGDKFAKKYSYGAFKGLDFLKTNFTGYRMCLTYETNHRLHNKYFSMSPYLNDQLFENANNGMIYY